MTKSQFNVFWTDTALQDLKRIIGYIATDSHTRAEEVFLAIKEKANNLQAMPAQGRIVPELHNAGIASYREIISSPWRIIYKMNTDRVWALAVVDGRRNIEDILLERFI